MWPSTMLHRRSRGRLPRSTRDCSVGTACHVSATITPIKYGVIGRFSMSRKKMHTFYFIRRHNRAVPGAPSNRHRSARSEIRLWKSGLAVLRVSRASASEVLSSSSRPWPRHWSRAAGVKEPSGNIVVDIGGGTPDIALHFSMTASFISVRCALTGNEMY